MCTLQCQCNELKKIFACPYNIKILPNLAYFILCSTYASCLLACGYLIKVACILWQNADISCKVMTSVDMMTSCTRSIYHTKIKKKQKKQQMRYSIKKNSYAEENTKFDDYNTSFKSHYLYANEFWKLTDKFEISHPTLSLKSVGCFNSLLNTNQYTSEQDVFFFSGGAFTIAGNRNFHFDKNLFSTS